MHSLLPFPDILAWARLKEWNACLADIIVELVFEGRIRISRCPFCYNGFHLFGDWLVACDEMLVNKKLTGLENGKTGRTE